MSHPWEYSVHMKRNIQPLTALSNLSDPTAGSTSGVRTGTPESSAGKAVTRQESESLRSGLLGLCHEIAGLLLRRQIEQNDAAAVRREVRARLVKMMACTGERADRLIDLSLELIHVKIHGRYDRNPLELSLLIARAGNQLREVRDN